MFSYAVNLRKMGTAKFNNVLDFEWKFAPTWWEKIELYIVYKYIEIWLGLQQLIDAITSMT